MLVRQLQLVDHHLVPAGDSRHCVPHAVKEVAELPSLVDLELIALSPEAFTFLAEGVLGDSTLICARSPQATAGGRLQNGHRVGGNGWLLLRPCDFAG